MSADLEFQKRLYSQIGTAVSPTTVKAHPPHDLPLPFVQIGESTTEDHEIGREIFADVHVWSSAEGPHEVKTLQQSIRATMHATSWSSGGFTFSCCREDQSRVMQDIDREVWHGVQTFRVLAS